MFVFVIATFLFHFLRLVLFSYSSVTCVYLCGSCLFCNWSSGCSVSKYIKWKELLRYSNYYSVFPCQRPSLRDSSFLAPRSDPNRFQVSRCSTSRNTRYVPSTAVFCTESIECFPDTASKVFFKTSVIMF